MAKQTINIGSTADDGTGSTLRAGGDLVNDNFNEIYNKLGDGTDLHNLTFPNATDTVVARDTTDTLTNKTINSASNTITVTESDISDLGSYITATSTDTLENKTISGSSNTLSNISTSSISFSGSTITGITSLQTETLTNASGNLLVDSATNIVEIRGDGASVVGQLQLNCHVNTHGQIVASQPHSEAATNVLTLPGGSTIGNSDATLLSDTGTQTISNKTIGVTQLTGNTRIATGDGSTVNFTVTDGTTTDNTLVFVNGSITTDYTISSTTLTFGSPPAGSAAIVIKEL